MRFRNVVGAAAVWAFLIVTDLVYEPVALLGFGALSVGILFLKPEQKGRLF